VYEESTGHRKSTLLHIASCFLQLDQSAVHGSTKYGAGSRRIIEPDAG
jgi:hypothetical protein